MRDVKPYHVSAVIAECSGLSNQMQSRILGTMRQFMDAAEADGLIIKNSCKGIKARGSKSPEKEPLTLRQQEKLYIAAKGEHLEPFVLAYMPGGAGKRLYNPAVPRRSGQPPLKLRLTNCL